MREKFGVLPSYYRKFAIGIALSLGLHLGVMGLYSLLQEKVEEVIQRITFEKPPPPGFFVKPPTATTKVLEFRKVPVPQDHFLRQRTQTTTQTRVEQVQALAALRTDAVVEQLEVAEVTPAVMRNQGTLGGARGCRGRGRRYGGAGPSRTSAAGGRGTGGERGAASGGHAARYAEREAPRYRPVPGHGHPRSQPAPQGERVPAHRPGL